MPSIIWQNIGTGHWVDMWVMSWTPLAATQNNPFAGAANVGFSRTPWTKDISRGEMFRAGYDQRLTISPYHQRYLYQTNSTC